MTPSKKDKKRGFTLMEFLIAIVILGAIAGWAYPQYLVTLEIARIDEAKQNLIMVLASQRRHFLRNGSYASAVSDLDIEPRPLNYFGSVTLGSGSPEIASFTRSGSSQYGSYSIRIGVTGDIICTNGNNNICDRANLPTSWPS